MRLWGSTAALAATVVAIAGPAVRGEFPDCNANGLDDTVETATTFTETVVDSSLYRSQLADLDADGDLDLLGGLPEPTPGVPATFLTWRKNLDGAGTFGAVQQIDDLVGRVVPGDLDDDGDLDLAFAYNDCVGPGGGTGVRVSTYENLGGGTFADPVVRLFVPWTSSGCGCPALFGPLAVGDRDSDGDLDIYIAGLTCAAGVLNTLWNDGSGEGWVATHSQWSSSLGKLADVDSDGDNDRLVGGANQIFWIEGPGDGTEHTVLTVGDMLGVLLLEDLDGDGDPDIVADRQDPYDLAVYENVTGLGNYFAPHVITPIGATGTTRLAGGDLDGDGDTDLLWQRVPGERVQWHLNALGTFGAPQPPLGQAIGTSFAMHIDTGDVDGDGDLDVLVPYYGAPGTRLVWFRNQGNDCDGDRVPDACEPDCNTNGIADDCDIQSGASIDCDGSGTPDECDTGCPLGECDADGDGCQDAVDDAPGNATACGDSDADGCDDCSGGAFDPAGEGPNSDSDGVCDLTDCDPANSEAWVEPGAAVGLSLAQQGAATALSWTPPAVAGGIAPRYDVLRSTSASDFLSGAAAMCLESDEEDESASDAGVPAPGVAFHYLVRVENDCPGEGGAMGTDSSGVPRTGLPCVPTLPPGDGLVINEVNSLEGPNGFGRFVEVFNASDQAIDLAGWTLRFVSSGGSVYQSGVLLQGAGVLSPGGYLVVAAPSVVADPGAAVIPLPGNAPLSLTGGLALFDPATALADALSFGVSLTDVDFGTDGPCNCCSGGTVDCNCLPCRVVVCGVDPFCCTAWDALCDAEAGSLCTCCPGQIPGACDVPGTFNLVEGTLTPWTDSSTVEGSLVRFPNGVDTDDAAADWGFCGPPPGQPTPGSANAVPW